MARSPWLTVASARDYVLRTAQTRIYLDTRLAGGAPGLASIRLPIYAELAQAEARLTDLQCTGEPETSGVTLDVTPSIGRVAIADIEEDLLPELGIDMPLNTASLVSTAQIGVDGFSLIDFGGLSPQQVWFSKPEIDDRITKTVATNDLFESVATTLFKYLELDVEAFGLSLSAAPVTNVVSNRLNAAAVSLDTVFFELTETMGVKLGAADVRVESLRCGSPMLVS